MDAENQFLVIFSKSEYSIQKYQRNFKNLKEND